METTDENWTLDLKGGAMDYKPLIRKLLKEKRHVDAVDVGHLYHQGDPDDTVREPLLDLHSMEKAGEVRWEHYGLNRWLVLVEVMSWTHNICQGCWDKKYPGWKPFRLIDGKVEVCCYCGELTTDGIFVRDNPKNTYHCKHED